MIFVYIKSRRRQFILSLAMEKEDLDSLQTSLQNINSILSTPFHSSLLPSTNISALQQLYCSLADSFHLSHPLSSRSSKYFSTENCLALLLKLPESCQKQLCKLQERKKKLLNRHGSRGPYRSYSLEEKNYVVYLHRAGKTFATISKELEIPQKNVVRWCRESELREPSKRMEEREMESHLLSWMTQHKSSNLSHGQIKKKALELSRNPNFKASRGWLKNFLKRCDSLFEVQENNDNDKNDE